MELVFREMVPDDVAYVMATWLKSAVPHIWPELPAGIVFAEHHDLAAQILNRPGVRVHVAHPPDSESLILGYLIVDGETAVYLYVRDGMRRQGVARALAARASGIRWLGHMTPVSRYVAKLFPGAAFNPYRLFRPSEGAHVA